MESQKKFCFICFRHRNELLYCDEHEEYYCYKCNCCECMTDEQKIIYYERQIERLNADLYLYIRELNILRKKSSNIN